MRCESLLSNLLYRLVEAGINNLKYLRYRYIGIRILTNIAASINELKANPIIAATSGYGEPVYALS